MDTQDVRKQCELVAQEWATNPLFDKETQEAVKAMLTAELFAMSRDELVLGGAIPSWSAKSQILKHQARN